MGQDLISIVVCTRDRADVLALALRSLSEQSLDPSGYEVIVVDNDSTDGTAALVQDFCARTPTMRYVLEPRLGLSHARNRGLREARGHYVGYVDDDCKLPPEWLEVAAEVAKDQASAAFGGPSIPFYLTERPPWFRDRYGTHDLGPRARALAAGEYLYGMNMFFRRSVLEALGGFDPALGMTGRRIAYGEEIAVQMRIRSEMPGEVIHYDPRLYVYHLVPARKMTVSWALRSSWAAGRYSYLVHGERRTWSKRGRALARAGLEALALPAEVARGVLCRNRRRYPYFENFVFEQVRPRLTRLGALYERMRI